MSFKFLFLLLLASSCLGAFSPLVTRLKEEASLLEETLHDQTRAIPSISLEQIQHANDVINKLWTLGAEKTGVDKHFSEIKMPPIKFPEVKYERDYPALSRPLRQIQALPNPCGRGVVSYDPIMQNLEEGRFCTVEEAVCGNEVLTDLTITDVFRANWSNCHVTKLKCMPHWGSTGVTQEFNLQEQYGVTNCVTSLEDFLFSGSDAYAQVSCSGNTNFGYDSWGLVCATEMLVCDGETVYPGESDFFEDMIANNRCVVATSPCISIRDPCNKINYTCGFSEDLGVDNQGCPIQRYDVQCPDPTASESECHIAQIRCNGTIYDTNSYVQGQDKCDVVSLNCNGNNVILDSPDCTFREMMCNGSIEFTDYYRGALTWCVIDKTTCGSKPNCNTYVFACPSAPKCAYAVQSCELVTEKPLNTSSCTCPDDWEGDLCTEHRSYTCGASLVSPVPACIPSPLPDPNDALLSGDRKCTVFNDYKASANFGFLLDCSFSEPRNTTNLDSYNFTYWARNDKIAFSNRVAWQMRHKIFNLNRIFSDNSRATVSPVLTPDQILGNELIWFNISLGDVPDQFWYARRLYYELGFSIGPGKTALHGFIDAPTRPISTKTISNIHPATIIAIVLGITIPLIIIGYFSFKCYRHHRKNPPLVNK